MSGNRLSKQMSDGYLKAATTVICPYCSKVRNRDNLHQTKPRIKCIPCYERRALKGTMT